MLERDAGNVLARKVKARIKNEKKPRILPQKRVFLRNLGRNNSLFPKILEMSVTTNPIRIISNKAQIVPIREVIRISPIRPTRVRMLVMKMNFLDIFYRNI
jgi:hypothetical protein